jgi:hypothetical protein
MELSFESISDALTSNHVPAIMIAAGGVLALLIVLTYLKNKESLTYKFMVFLGLVVGVLLIIISIGVYDTWDLYATVIVILAGFTLVIRPFREVDFAVLIALLVIAVAYVSLGNLAGGSLEILSDGWPRIIVAVAVGIFAYTALHFLQSVVKLFGKLLNWWPVLMILGFICIAEAVAMYYGYASIYDYIQGAAGIITGVQA